MFIPTEFLHSTNYIMVKKIRFNRLPKNKLLDFTRKIEKAFNRGTKGFLNNIFFIVIYNILLWFMCIKWQIYLGQTRKQVSFTRTLVDKDKKKTWTRTTLSRRGNPECIVQQLSRVTHQICDLQWSDYRVSLHEYLRVLRGAPNLLLVRLLGCPFLYSSNYLSSYLPCLDVKNTSGQPVLRTECLGGVNPPMINRGNCLFTQKWKLTVDPLCINHWPFPPRSTENLLSHFDHASWHGAQLCIL